MDHHAERRTEAEDKWFSARRHDRHFQNASQNGHPQQQHRQNDQKKPSRSQSFNFHQPQHSHHHHHHHRHHHHHQRPYRPWWHQQQHPAAAAAAMTTIQMPLNLTTGRVEVWPSFHHAATTSQHVLAVPEQASEQPQGYFSLPGMSEVCNLVGSVLNTLSSSLLNQQTSSLNPEAKCFTPLNPNAKEFLPSGCRPKSAVAASSPHHPSSNQKAQNKEQNFSDLVGESEEDGTPRISPRRESCSSPATTDSKTLPTEETAGKTIHKSSSTSCPISMETVTLDARAEEEAQATPSSADR